MMTLDVPLPTAPQAPPEQSTDEAYLVRSPLAHYGTEPRVWRCPADHSTRTINGERLLRIRSISMNEHLGTYHPYKPIVEDHHPPWHTTWMTQLMVKKTADIRNPGPVQCFVFLDEREDSIKGSQFLVHPDGFLEADPTRYRLAGYPGSYHNRAGNFSFADGHAESHRWLDPHTTPRLVRDTPIFGTAEGNPSSGNRDVQWIQERTFQRPD